MLTITGLDELTGRVGAEGRLDWSAAVANSWDPTFALVAPPEGGRTFIRDIARDKGVEVLGFFYAGPLMKSGFDTGVITYGALRGVRPGSVDPAP